MSVAVLSIIQIPRVDDKLWGGLWSIWEYTWGHVTEGRNSEEANSTNTGMNWIRTNNPQHWTDPHLAWNMSEYGGLKTIRIPSKRLWVPDIVLYNSVDETKPATEVFPQTNCIVSNNGYILWVVPAMIKSSCKIDITYFPFDQQNCDLKFGSWTYDGFLLNLNNILDSGDLTKFIPSGEWDLIGMPAKRNVEYYSCCEEPFVDVTYTVIIRRMPMFFTYNLVFPCVLLMGIGILVFCLPPESGEKVSLGVTVLLAMTVYQLLIAETIPPTSEVVPLIGQFFGATIFLLSLSTAMTVVVMKLHFSGEHGSRVPPWLRKLVLVCLARVVRMGKHTKDTYRTREYGCTDISGPVDLTLLNHAGALKEEPAYNMVLLNNIMPNDRSSPRHGFGSHSSSQYNHNHSDVHTMTNSKSRRDRYEPSSLSEPRDYEGSDTNTLLYELLCHVKQVNEEIHQHLTNQETEEIFKSEWRLVALILDRLLLILFFIMTCFTSIVIFVNVPNW
ncbi:hypothetical protein LSH36_568g03027 [Paralvinella palmiformis]|uniref:Uncharacterized protein n=1 Tax=Paralvinella palmiformis TaxID=53620 RepID=A0AAD9MWW9_9ANNE|nr:hypothetical protein LSH36_568g03027 [Paralvinella palmiformis]